MAKRGGFPGGGGMGNMGAMMKQGQKMQAELTKAQDLSLIHIADNQMLPRMQEVSDAHGGASVIAVMPVPDDQVSRFGVIAGAAVADDVWKVDALVEKPALEDAPSNLAVFSINLSIISIAPSIPTSPLSIQRL